MKHVWVFCPQKFEIVVIVLFSVEHVKLWGDRNKTPKTCILNEYHKRILLKCSDYNTPTKMLKIAKKKQ